MTHYSELEILELSKISLDIATKIIQNTKGNLWKILIQDDKIDFKNSKEYLQAIYKYCLNIEYVSIFIDNQSLDEFEKLLISCHYIKGMDIHIQTINDF